MAPFITFEGIDGCGKSTQVQLLHSYLTNQGIEVSLLREPGSTSIGELIRSILLSNKTSNLLPISELLLYSAARNQNVHENIVPALNDGVWVLCDRFKDATVAYQGYGLNLDLNLIESLNELVSQNRQPDITILIDIDPNLALSRARKRNLKNHNDEGRYEQESLTFYHQVRKGYLEIAKKEPQRIHIINGSQSIKEIQNEITQLIMPLLYSGETNGIP